MKILLDDLKAIVGLENISQPTIGNESVHPVSNDSSIRLGNFTTSKNHVKGTQFPHHNIQKYTWTSPDGITNCQKDHVLVVKRSQSNIIYSSPVIMVFMKSGSPFVESSMSCESWVYGYDPKPFIFLTIKIWREY
jgi:hypothetical protein